MMPMSSPVIAIAMGMLCLCLCLCLGALPSARGFEGHRSYDTTAVANGDSWSHRKPLSYAECPNNVLFALFSGFRTTNRTLKVWNTWGAQVKDHLHLFTDKPPAANVVKDLGAHRVHVLKPCPQETMVEHMSAWSHIVRVRAAWELFMHDNADYEWLFLMDDDVYLFMDTFCQLLEQKSPRWISDSKGLVWAGLLELIPYDWVHNKGVIPRPAHDKNGKWSQEIVPQGAVVLMHRKLVKEVYPYLDRCERETAPLGLQSWGSQRLWMCVHGYMMKDKLAAHRSAGNSGPAPRVVAGHLSTHMWKESQSAFAKARRRENADVDKARAAGKAPPAGSTRARDGQPVMTFHHLTPKQMDQLYALDNLYKDEGHALTFDQVAHMFRT